VPDLARLQGLKPGTVRHAFSKQVLYNAVSRQRFVFHTTADQSDGRLLEFDLVIEPHDAQVLGSTIDRVTSWFRQR
jgi:hypothetical protein